MSTVFETPTQVSVDEFIERSQALTGQVVTERTPWNNIASLDAIRHFAYGTNDDNPLWLDEAYASKSRFGTIVAPPAFLTSVLYPILHGAPVLAPLSSLIGGVEYEWRKPILVNDRLRAESRQAKVFEKKSQSGRRLVFIISEITYWNDRDEIVATAKGTMIRATQTGTELLFDRPLQRYSDVDLEPIVAAIRAEADSNRRRRETPLYFGDVKTGDEIPRIARGPLTIGDLVCWQAGIGPAYRSGTLGYLDVLKAPHSAVKSPVIGWPVKFSQQHEDAHMAAQRGMPGPFDNGVMRFAWVAPFLTNWMGRDGFLKRLSVQVRQPAIYGDTQWYGGSVTQTGPTDEAGGVVTIKIDGVNQLGEPTTSGEAEVVLPHRR